MRPLVTTYLFVAAAAGLVSSAEVTGQQPPEKKQPKKVQPKPDPAANKPDEATLKLIREKTETLREAADGLKAKGVPDDILADVEVYRKAAEWVARHGEWFVADNGKSTLHVLDKGIDRAKAAADGKVPWRDVRDKPVVRGYRSRVDGSVQPFSIVYPDGFDPAKKYRLDVVLHGRDATLTEVKFINAKENAKAGKAPDHLVMEVYGRGNNAYRWAGETDVIEAMRAVSGPLGVPDPVDHNRVVLRGFSMGGAGTWHIGLHYPDRFCVIGPGAGFTTTHGYVGGLPAKLPDYQEKCLHIYDAVDYAENAFDVPVVAYSGEIDPQKKAADNIEAALKRLNEPLRFTHLVAPGLAHQMPAQWQAKAEAEYREYADKGRDRNPERVRFVTYTPTYGKCHWVMVAAMERIYERAVVDARRQGNKFTITTTNVRRLTLADAPGDAGALVVTIDGQTPDLSPAKGDHLLRLYKADGKWRVLAMGDWKPWQGKSGDVQGPIDDAYRDHFQVVGPTRPGGFAAARMQEFATLWDRYFRGALPVIEAKNYERRKQANPDRRVANLVLFGDPETNPLLAEVLPELPITWTKEKLVVNGVEYNPKTHIPVLIYPNPFDATRYVVINTGHTFKKVDLEGTNALLYPRLGDWAVIKPTPTDTDPAAFEVVAAGLFDENWKFPRK
jgi:hypothetical protein